MHRTLMLVAGLLFAGSVFAAPDDLEETYTKLQAAVAAKDATQVKELAPKVCAMARELGAKPAPTEESEKTAWEKSVKYAKDVESYTEYALYSTAVQSPAPVLVEMWEMLEGQNAKSKYFAGGYGPYLAALTQTGQGARIATVAEKASAQWPDDEDLQLVLADVDMNRSRVGEAGVHAERLIAIFQRHPAPEGMGAAWERKKTQGLGRSYWIAGQAHASRGEYGLADVDLRNSLPLLAGQDAMLAGAYFQLGVANYHLGRQALNFRQVAEGASFSEKAAAIRGPYQDQARVNAAAMRREAEKMRGAR